MTVERELLQKKRKLYLPLRMSTGCTYLSHQTNIFTPAPSPNHNQA